MTRSSHRRSALTRVGGPVIGRNHVRAASGPLGAGRSLHLVFLVLNAARGGHTRTACTIARALQARGHQIHIVTSDGADDSILADSGMRTIRADLRPGTVRRRLTSILERVEAEGEAPLAGVHSFSRDWLGQVIRASLDFGARPGWTICGGSIPKDATQTAPLFVHSEELRDELALRPGRAAIRSRVVEGRIDVETIDTAALAQSESEVRDQLATYFGSDWAGPLVIRVARLGPTYLRSILEGAALAEVARRNGLDARFLHVGYTESEGSHAVDDLRWYFERLNKRNGTVVAATCDAMAENPLPYVRKAALVLGSGRSAIESLLLGRPTAIVGRNGYAGLIRNARDLEHLGYWNLSGRNRREWMSLNTSAEEAWRGVNSILNSPNSINPSLRDRVKERFDVASAAAVYEEAYSSPLTTQGSDMRKGAFAYQLRNVATDLRKSYRVRRGGHG